MKQFPPAHTNYDRALKMYRDLYKNEYHQKVAMVLMNIGILWGDEKEFHKAIKFYEQSLPIYIKTLGEKHPDVAMVYGNLGVAWSQLGNQEKAIEYELKALAIKEATFEFGHPSLAMSHWNISCSYVNMNQLNNALKHREIAYKMMAKHDPAHKLKHTKQYK